MQNQGDSVEGEPKVIGDPLEGKVLKLRAQKKDYFTIAGKLGISPDTADLICTRFKRKGELTLERRQGLQFAKELAIYDAQVFELLQRGLSTREIAVLFEEKSEARVISTRDRLRRVGTLSKARVKRKKPIMTPKPVRQEGSLPLL